MPNSKKQFRIWSNKYQGFQHGTGYGSNSWSGRVPKSWKTLASLLDKIDQNVLGRGYWKRYTDEEPIEFDRLDGMELVEYEVVLKEVKRTSLKELMIERERERMIHANLGYKVSRMYKKMKADGLEGFRYIIAFDDPAAFFDAKDYLKELDIVHGRQYRFTDTVIIFSCMDDATLTKLTYPEDTSSVYDLETLSKIDVEEEQKNRAKTKC